MYNNICSQIGWRQKHTNNYKPLKQWDIAWTNESMEWNNVWATLIILFRSIKMLSCWPIRSFDFHIHPDVTGTNMFLRKSVRVLNQSHFDNISLECETFDNDKPEDRPITPSFSGIHGKQKQRARRQGAKPKSFSIFAPKLYRKQYFQTFIALWHTTAISSSLLPVCSSFYPSPLHGPPTQKT